MRFLLIVPKGLIHLSTPVPLLATAVILSIFQLLLEPSTPVLPGSHYTASGSELAVHMAVDHKNRVYACLAADDVPPSLAFSLLEEV